MKKVNAVDYFISQAMGSIKRYYPELTDVELREMAIRVLEKKNRLEFTSLTRKGKNVKPYFY